MKRYKITIEYDGSPFVGWQRQDNGPSVQAALEAAIADFSGESVVLTAAGRTDAGVHARGQVAHFDLERAHPPETVQNAINALVRPHPIVVTEAEEVNSEFNARLSAVKRHYLYRVFNRRAPPALERHMVWWVPQALHVDAMVEAAQAFLGNHDFTTFRAAQCQAKSPVKTMDFVAVHAAKDDIYFRFSARSFLHSQVRSMVGSLVQVGRGKWPTREVAAALAARDRSRCGPLAPPSGLYLMQVDYPPAEK